MNIFRPVRKTWDYLKPAWEGSDGKPSYRRVAQMMFLVLIVFAVVKGQTLNRYGFYSLVTLCLTFLLLAAIISAQQIVDCIKGVGQFKSTTFLGGQSDEVSTD